MNLWDKIFGEFIDVIEWLDSSDDTMVYRFQRYGNEIKYGAKLIVRESQVAVFVNEGEVADILGPGIYELETKNLPILSTLQHWDHGFESPFKAEVYFCNMRRFVDLKWGTRNPIMMRDKEFGMVRIRAFGNYSIKIENPKKFLQEIVGTDGHFTVDEISSELKNIIISRFSNIVAKSNIPVLDLAANYSELNDYITQKISPEFKEYGLELTKIMIENISVPSSVEEVLDKRTSMGMIGNLDKYLKYQTAEALTSIGENGSSMSEAISLGVGFAMAKDLVTEIEKKEKIDDYVPLKCETMYYYADGKNPIGPLCLEKIENLIQQYKITKETKMWTSGLKEWQEASNFEELKPIFDSLTPPPLN